MLVSPRRLWEWVGFRLHCSNWKLAIATGSYSQSCFPRLQWNCSLFSQKYTRLLNSHLSRRLCALSSYRIKQVQHLASPPIVWSFDTHHSPYLKVASFYFLIIISFVNRISRITVVCKRGSLWPEATVKKVLSPACWSLLSTHTTNPRIIKF